MSRRCSACDMKVSRSVAGLAASGSLAACGSLAGCAVTVDGNEAASANRTGTAKRPTKPPKGGRAGKCSDGAEPPIVPGADKVRPLQPGGLPAGGSMKRVAVVIATLCFSVLFAPPARAQGGYFGQNKVQYHTFKFQVLKTDHFDIYYYAEEAQAARMAARMAERWYTRLSSILSHELRG